VVLLISGLVLVGAAIVANRFIPAAKPSTYRRPATTFRWPSRPTSPPVDLGRDDTAHDRGFSDLWPKG
jgi:hypothetical protein